jgi:hypothetical protein
VRSCARSAGRLRRGWRPLRSIAAPHTLSSRASRCAAATINKLLAESLPADLKLSAEVRDIFTDCCTGARGAPRRRLAAESPR